jgi:hypothetical protein
MSRALCCGLCLCLCLCLIFFGPSLSRSQYQPEDA